VRLLGSEPRVTLPDGVVRRVAAHADAHYPRHPHEPDSVPSKSRQRAALGHDRRDHARRTRTSVLTVGSRTRLHPPPSPLLAPPRRDAPRVCGTHAGREGVAPPSAVDLKGLAAPHEGLGVVLLRTGPNRVALCGGRLAGLPARKQGPIVRPYVRRAALCLASPSARDRRRATPIARREAETGRPS